MTPIFPDSARPVLTVVSNSDEGFFEGLRLAVASALAAASGKYDYHFLILDGGLSQEKMDALAVVLDGIAAKRGINVKLELLHIDQNRLAALPERRGSRMTYAKLVLPEVLSDLQSIVYLDADVVCFAGLEDFMIPDEEADQWLLAGIRDFFSVIENECPWLDQVPQSERKLPYINCGIMWINLEGLRKMGFTDKAITARAALPNARQGDQSVFNFLCRGKIKLLPAKLNHCAALGANRLLLEAGLDSNVHYIGARKPWKKEPKTSNWLVHKLWHQARARVFGGIDLATNSGDARPFDEREVRRKGLFYTVLNPKRGSDYRADLRSLEDPTGLFAEASDYWDRVLPK